MPQMRRVLTAFALLAVVLAPPMPAVAQSGPAGVPSQAPAAASPAPSAPALPSSDRRAQRVERRVRDWHDRLRITPAQEGQWSAFATVMRENMQRMEAMHAEQRQAAATMTALDDMRSYARVTQAHADEIQRLIGPFEALYNSLSPEQRQIADQAFRSFQEREERGRRRRG